MTTPVVESLPQPILNGLATHLDSFLETRAAHGLYGAAIVVVHRGEVLLAKGFGEADPIAHAPLAIETAVLPVASIAKAFTATAVMQLVERGLLDLETDVGTYLRGYELQAPDAAPVTIGHLLSHTEGFQECNLGIVATATEGLNDLAGFFKHRMPRRVLPPGKHLTYGNWASGLLGLVVEQVSGLPFHRYVRDHVFAPLGMSSSTFEQPAPSHIAERCLRECVRDGKGRYHEAPHVYAKMAPAGGMHAGALDMAAYLIAMTGDGSYQGRHLLAEQTVRAMRERRFQAHPELPGITYGFFEEMRNGRRVLRRDGDAAAVWSRMYLVPEAELGIFYAVAGDEEARLSLADALFDHLWPTGSESMAPRTVPGTACQRYEGVYRYLQYNRDTFSKLQSLLVGQVRVRADRAGGLTVTALGAGDVYGGFEGRTRWEPIGENVFERADGKARLAFGLNEKGEVETLCSSMRYQGEFSRLSWYEAAPWQFAYFAAFLLSAVVSLIVLGALALQAQLPLGPSGTLWVLHSGLSTLFGVMLLPSLFLIGNVGGGFPAYGFGINAWIRGILTLPMGLSALALGLVLGLGGAMTMEAWPVPVRGLYALATLLACLQVLWLRYWNLLGYRW
ncbi:putative penicillin-binding protein PbpX [compost metagenome]